MPDSAPVTAATARPDLQKKLQEVPHRPGVYVHRDRLGKVIYVGKAKDLRKRLSHYFTPARSRLSDRKTRALIESIWDFETHPVRPQRIGVVFARREVDQGISAALQHRVPRRQALSPGACASR